MNAKMIAIVGNFVVPLLILFGLACWNYKEGGSEAVLKGVDVSFKMLIGVALVIAIAFLITGQAQVIAKRHEAEIREYLAGTHGVWGATLAGILAPTMSSFPFMEELWRAGKAPIGTVLAVVIGARLLNFQNILFFLPFLGAELTAVSIGVGLLIMGLFVPVTYVIAKIF